MSGTMGGDCASAQSRTCFIERWPRSVAASGAKASAESCARFSMGNGSILLPIIAQIEGRGRPGSSASGKLRFGLRDQLHTDPTPQGLGHALQQAQGMALVVGVFETS